MNTEFRSDLTTGSVPKQLIKFALPFLLSNFLQALYNIVDMVIVGRFSGNIASITGVNMGSQVSILVVGAAVGLSVGGTVLIAQYAGAKRYNEQREVIGTMTTIYLILSVIITVVMLALARPVLNLLNTPINAYSETLSYYRICIAGTVFMLLYNAISAILRGMGDSKRPMYFIIIATVVNIILDIILVAKFKMGAAGAAYATIAAQAISVILSVIFLVKKDFFKGYTLKDFKIKKDKMILLFKIGLPSSVQQVLNSLAFLTLTALVNGLPGADVLSASQGVASKINSLAILPAFAMSGAISSMAGQNLGAREYDRAKKTMLVGMGMAMIILLVVWGGINLFPEPIVRLFIEEKDAISTEVIKTTSEYIHYVSLDFLVAVPMFCMNGLAIAAGSTTFTLINTSVGALFIRVPVAYLLSRHTSLGFNGIGLSIGVGTVFSLIIVIIYTVMGKWKKTTIDEKKI